LSATLMSRLMAWAKDPVVDTGRALAVRDPCAHRAMNVFPAAHWCRRLRATAGWSVLAMTLLLGACAEFGDFGRTGSIFKPDRQSRIGAEAARASGAPASSFVLTDDEKLLRNLADPLVTSLQEKDTWDRVFADFQEKGTLPSEAAPFDPTIYATRLLTTPYRSATARYGRLIEDIRDDQVRIDPFAATARRVVDIDRKREQSLGYVSNLSGDEWKNAIRRIGENAMIIGWTQRSLRERAASYRIALERLVIETPTPGAVEAEHVLADLDRRITELNTIVGAYHTRGGAPGVPRPGVHALLPPGVR